MYIFLRSQLDSFYVYFIFNLFAPFWHLLLHCADANDILKTLSNLIKLHFCNAGNVYVCASAQRISHSLSLDFQLHFRQITFMQLCAIQNHFTFSRMKIKHFPGDMHFVLFFFAISRCSRQYKFLFQNVRKLHFS